MIQFAIPLESLSQPLRDGRGGLNLLHWSLQACSKHTVTFLELRFVVIIIVVIISEEVWEVSRCASCNTVYLRLPDPTLFPDLVTAARAAMCRATGHFYLPGHPVYLRVVLLKSGMSEDEVLVSQSSDHEEGAL